MEQLREMDSISLVTIPSLRAGYYSSLPLIVQPAIHTNNRWDLNDGLFHARALNWQSDSHRKLSLLTWANPARCPGWCSAPGIAAATPGIALGTATGAAQTSPSAPGRDKPAPKEVLLSGRGMFKLSSVFQQLHHHGAHEVQAPETLLSSCWCHSSGITKKSSWFLNPCGLLMHFLHRHCPVELLLTEEALASTPQWLREVHGLLIQHQFPRSLRGIEHSSRALPWGGQPMDCLNLLYLPAPCFLPVNVWND